MNFDELLNLNDDVIVLSGSINGLVGKLFNNGKNIDIENICVLFLRGNDKATECNIPEYNEYIIEGKKILEKNNNIRFLIQSDETEFIETMKNEFKNLKENRL